MLGYVNLFHLFVYNVEMELQEFFCDSMYDWWNQYPYKTGRTIAMNCELMTWVVGILANLVNVVVFRHKNMGTNPINSIFWWLSISDLLELAILGLYQWDCNRQGTLEIIDERGYSRESIFYFVRYLGYIYLFLVFHTVTIALNIVLIFYQYMVVAHPLINKNHPRFNNRFVKLTVICIYILSFILFLPFWNIHRVQYISWTGVWKCTVKALEEPRVYISILVCGIVLRIGPLIILIILCIMLLFAIRNTQRNRRNLGMQARHLSKGQRQVNRMNATIVMIIIMFLITDIPLAISSVFVLSREFDCRVTIERVLLYPFMLLNCCYSIFCYLIRIKRYRGTLKLLLSKKNWTSSSAPVTEQTDLELQSL